MPKFEPTKAQRDAIEAEGKTLLVSAAAGSGKTKVLQERIIRMLTKEKNPSDILHTLVVTFTRAAAGELRRRISTAITEALANNPENTHLAKQLVSLGSAPISTIDSFYLDLVRAHFQEIGFPASFRLADENELLSLRRDLMQDVVDRMYRDEPAFSKISDLYCNIRRENVITDKLLEIYDTLKRYIHGVDTLKHSAEQMLAPFDSPLDTPWGKIWEETVREAETRAQTLSGQLLEAIKSEADSAALEKKYGDAYREIHENATDILAMLNAHDYEGTRSALLKKREKSCSNGKFNASDDFNVLLALCEKIRKDFFKNAAALAVFSTEEIRESGKESAEILLLLHKTLQRFEEEYLKQKLKRELLEFSDVSDAAFHLLVDDDGNPTALALEVAKHYKEIYIDEYQDVDAKQDLTFRAIASPTNRFMVGDIKQSIYRFRGANPAVFTGYRKAFPLLEEAEGSNEATIFMSDCFRCAMPIVQFSNTVSGHLFSMPGSNIGYSKLDDLRCKKPPSPKHTPVKCKVVLVDRDKSERKKTYPEYVWIAKEIKRLLGSEEETKLDGKRIAPKDIAIMMRNRTGFAKLEKELRREGIPVKNSSQQNFFENADVICVYSLLAALDNPQRDVYMAATLRSPFFSFTLEDLVRIRHNKDDSLSLYESVLAAEESEEDTAFLARITAFKKRFALWREKARTLPVDRLLRYLYRETAILSFAGRTQPGEDAATRRANLRRLYECARTFEAGSFKGLYQFIRYIDGIMENKGKLSAPDGEGDGVSLITIHHSKGLEYPVCFIANTLSPIADKDARPAFLCDEMLGCATRLSNAGPFSRCNTFQRDAIALSLKKQAVAEEMRILYVAMTRAQERLYVTACPARNSSVDSLNATVALAAHPLGDYLTATGPSYMHWILTALLRTDHSEYAELLTVKEEDLTVSKQDPYNPKPPLLPKWGKKLKRMLRQFEFTYPYEHLMRLPAKLPVSKLSPTVLDAYNADPSGLALDPSSEEPLLLREYEFPFTLADILGVEDDHSVRGTKVIADEEEAEEATAHNYPRTAREKLLHTFEKKPDFLGEDSGNDAAALGSATHEFLQFCNFERAKEDLEAELDRLVDNAFLPPETKNRVRKNELRRFFKSRFFKMLEKGRDIYREKRFNILLPATRFTSNEELKAKLEGESIVVQGVIDLFFTDEDGKLVLCDYKTDRLSKEELADPARAAETLSNTHRNQLSYYTDAMEQICGKRPDRILIYSLPLGEAVELIP